MVSIEKNENLQEELGITAADGPDEGISVCGSLGNRLAESQGINGVIYCEVQMMGSDGSYNTLTSVLNHIITWGIYIYKYIYHRMGGISVPATVGPQERTVSTAAEVVQCSSTILSFGNLSLMPFKVGRKASSAFITSTSGTSPCKLSTMSCSCMASNTG